MKKKNIKIPIYFGELTIIQTDDLKKVSDKYDTLSMHGFDGCCFRNNDSNGYCRYIIAFLNDPSPTIIAHECLHFVGYLFKDRGINFSITNDEPQCYLLGWAVDECHKFLKCVL